MKTTFKSLSYVMYFLVTQVIAVTGLMFWKMTTDNDWFESVGDCLVNGEGVFSMRYFSLISEILFPALIIADLLIIIPIMIVAAKKQVKVFRGITFPAFSSLVILAGALNMVISCIVEIIPESKLMSDYAQLTEVLTSGDFGVVLIASGILAPIVEELIFRYGFIYLNKDKDLRKVVFLSSLAFGIAHMNPVQSTYAFLLGLVLGYVYIKSDFNLTSTVLMHVVINSTSVIFEYAIVPVKLVLLVLGVLSILAVIYQSMLSYNKKKV